MTNKLPMFPSPVLIDRDGNETRIQHGDIIEVRSEGHQLQLTYRRPDPSMPDVDNRLRVMKRDDPDSTAYDHVIRGHQPVCPDFHLVFHQVIGALLGMQVSYRPNLKRRYPAVFLVWDTAIAPFPD